jgi:hypothetical protein
MLPQSAAADKVEDHVGIEQVDGRQHERSGLRNKRAAHVAHHGRTDRVGAAAGQQTGRRKWTEKCMSNG